MRNREKTKLEETRLRGDLTYSRLLKYFYSKPLYARIARYDN